MYRVALRLIGDADRAHDVVQEACLKALAGLGGFNEESMLSTWLHRITVNCAKDALRTKAGKDVPQRLRPARRPIAGAGASPPEAAEARELCDLAWKLLRNLPADCHSAFALTQLDGYSYDEAARIEDQPRGTIASRVHRAKKMLLEQMNARIDGRTKP
jgi:RNA polymerase sigma-70 factor (ECF subfamily)